jgi:hypothetical protein
MEQLSQCLVVAQDFPRFSQLSQGVPIHWWRSMDGQSFRGYAASNATGDAFPWTTLHMIMQLDGASQGEPANYHYVVETDVADADQADFNAWYETEHLPGLARVPGTIRARRYVRASGGPRYVACYDLVSPAAMERDEWLAVRHTAWSSRVRPLFRNTFRTLYARHEANLS